MTSFKYTLLNNYSNRGQNKEQSVRLALTGRLEKADNIRADLATDCLQYQIKSSRATVCIGTDIERGIECEKATEFIYASDDGIAYIMSKSEYLEFVNAFKTIDHDSKTNTVKVRIKAENRMMREWLSTH